MPPWINGAARAAGLVFSLLAGLPAASPTPGASRSATVPPPTRLLLGPEKILCGVTAPASGSPAHGSGRDRRLGLILWFHGGMRGPNREKGLEAHRPLLDFVDPSAHVLASPSAFAGRDWLSPGALATTEALIDTLLSLHSIDPGNIRLIGVSDGSLAVLRYGRGGRRRSQALIMVSSLPQLAVPPGDLHGDMRIAEGRWNFLQGGRDRLFPKAYVVPYLREWVKLYPVSRLHYFPEGEHDFSWYATHASPLLRELLGAGVAPPDDGQAHPPKNPKQ